MPLLTTSYNLLLFPKQCTVGVLNSLLEVSPLCWGWCPAPWIFVSHHAAKISHCFAWCVATGRFLKWFGVYRGVISCLLSRTCYSINCSQPSNSGRLPYPDLCFDVVVEPIPEKSKAQHFRSSCKGVCDARPKRSCEHEERPLRCSTKHQASYGLVVFFIQDNTLGGSRLIPSRCGGKSMWKENPGIQIHLGIW